MHSIAQDAETQKFHGSLLSDKLMLPALPLLIGGVKQIIVLFSVVFSQETNGKTIPLNYHAGESSILQYLVI